MPVGLTVATVTCACVWAIRGAARSRQTKTALGMIAGKGSALASNIQTVPNTVRRCIVCGQTRILTTTADRLVRVVCRHCGAEFEVEFDPPDAPALKGRIEIIQESTLPAPERPSG